MKITCKAGASKGDNIYTKILRKFIWLVYVFKNSVLVFICKLANQRRQRLPIHRFYRHIQVRKSRKEYCCAPLHGRDAVRVLDMCTGTLTQPRTLSYFVPEIVECPVRRTEFHVKEGESVENIPSNQFINNILELLTLSPTY